MRHLSLKRLANYIFKSSFVHLPDFKAATRMAFGLDIVSCTRAPNFLPVSFEYNEGYESNFPSADIASRIVRLYVLDDIDLTLHSISKLNLYRSRII